MPMGSIPEAAWMVLTLTTTARAISKAHPNPLRMVFLLARNVFMHLLLQIMHFHLLYRSFIFPDRLQPGRTLSHLLSADQAIQFSRTRADIPSSTFPRAHEYFRIATPFRSIVLPRLVKIYTISFLSV
jgi:hypothetical protein